MSQIEIYNKDSMEAMAEMEHNVLDLEGYEIDPDYFEAAQKRLKNHQAQLKAF